MDDIETQVCKNCNYWKIIDWEIDEGECRRNAPVYHTTNRAFPITMKDDWCGEWKLRQKTKS